MKFIPTVLVEKNHPAESLANLFWRAHDHARQAVRAALIERSPGEMAKVAAVTAADTIYGIDVIAETALLQFLETYQHEAPPFLLIGEFETGEAMQFGTGAPAFRVLLDPIDGTRLLMHQKASGWILTGIAPEKGEATRLSDIFFALQTELPTSKQLYALMTGQLRLVADLRPLLNLYWFGINEPAVFCAHPYDLATSLIAQQAGVVLCATNGTPFNGPTYSTAEIGWLGFANQALVQRYLEPLLQLLKQHKLLSAEF